MSPEGLGCASAGGTQAEKAQGTEGEGSVSPGRDRAREIARERWDYSFGRDDTADAASDYWEPLLRELADASAAVVEGMWRTMRRGYVPDLDQRRERYAAALAAAREAVGTEEEK